MRCSESGGGTDCLLANCLPPPRGLGGVFPRKKSPGPDQGRRTCQCRCRAPAAARVTCERVSGCEHAIDSGHTVRGPADEGGGGVVRQREGDRERESREVRRSLRRVDVRPWGRRP